MINTEYSKNYEKVRNTNEKAKAKLEEIRQEEIDFLKEVDRAYEKSRKSPEDTAKYIRLINKAHDGYAQLKDRAQEIISWTSKWLEDYESSEKIEAAALKAGFDLSSIPGYEEYYANK